MAQAQFHKDQRVYVQPVGTWAKVEKILPQWAKGLDVPIRIYYDVGMGRDFAAEELQAEHSVTSQDEDGDRWHLVRMRNKWQSDTECSNHPYPGTYSVVATSEMENTGWRVPGAEYALSPTRIERQARMMVCAPMMANVARALWYWAQNAPEEVPDHLHDAIIQEIGRAHV